MVVFDSSFLIAMLDADAQLPPDPKTKKPIEKARERIEFLVDTLSASKTRVLVPAPVLAEVLVYGGSATADYLQKLRSESVFVVGDFNALAAAECAQLTRAALSTGSKKGKLKVAWQKVKIDRQIIAIARVSQADTLYTVDEGLAGLATASQLKVRGIADLAIPPIKDQNELFGR
jgi:predicted nucleic acid-binding protein